MRAWKNATLSACEALLERARDLVALPEKSSRRARRVR
jgi:hypothetical protein